MGELALFNFALQRFGDVILADNIGEHLRAVFSLKHLIQAFSPPLKKYAVYIKNRQDTFAWSHSSRLYCVAQYSCLMLLGSPPDMVRSILPHRTRCRMTKLKYLADELNGAEPH